MAANNNGVEFYMATSNSMGANDNGCSPGEGRGGLGEAGA